MKSGGARRDRTADLLRAKQALSQLSYGPVASLFSAWRRYAFRSVGHVPVCTLPPSLKARLASRKKFCATTLARKLPCQPVTRYYRPINPNLAPFFADRGAVSRRIACYASGAPTPSHGKWWVWEDLNFRPHPYQGCALTN